MSDFTAHVIHKHTIRLMQGAAIFAHVHFRMWDGQEGWQYTRYGYTSVRTRKLRPTAVEAMMAAPRLSRADRTIASDAIAKVVGGAAVLDRVLHLSEPEQAASAEIKRQMSAAVQHGATVCHLPDHQYPQTLMVHGALDVSLLVAAIEQELPIACASASTPAGWQPVPVQPTDAMICAGADGSGKLLHRGQAATLRKVWSAMLAASPDNKDTRR